MYTKSKNEKDFKLNEIKINLEFQLVEHVFDLIVLWFAARIVLIHEVHPHIFHENV